DDRVRAERARSFERSLARWVADVDRSQRAQIAAMVQGWPLDREASLRAAELRRTEIKQALRTLARTDLSIEKARAPLLHTLVRSRAAHKRAHAHEGDHALALRAAVMRSIVQFINAPGPAGEAQRQQMHKRWQAWQREIDRLRSEASV
ncbi:MAG TPA: hypothetical protein VFK82_07040, partial [Burkholderiaceae bacterium]|nr:hypothetical protein [Burkholderiaceae bacterium]